MSEKEQYNLKINAKNIGPLSSLSFNTTFDSSSPCVKIAIYAKNGSGKTMLSNLFNLTNKTQSELLSYNISKLVSKGEKNAEFLFKLSPSIDVKRKLEINIIKNGLTNIKNETGYIFHVFNSEYVKDNIMPRKYAPEDKIDGYIIGKANIDLSIQENNLKILKQAQVETASKIKEKYETAIKELDKLKIDKKTKEYKEFTYDSLFSENTIKKESFNDLKEKHKKINQIPDDIKNVPEIDYVIEESIFDIFDFLNKHFVKSSVSDELRNDISDNFDFIRNGVDLLHKNELICPFCRNKLDEQAKKLIDLYLQYLKDEEATAISKVQIYKNLIKNEVGKLDQFKRDLDYTIKFFDTLKDYLPSHSKIELSTIEFGSIRENLLKLNELLDIKSKDVTTIINQSELKDTLLKWFEKIVKIIDANNSKIKKINQTFLKLHEEKLNLNRSLCLSKRSETIQEINELLADYRDSDEKIQVLSKAIEDEKNKVKKAKKSAVADAIKIYLKYFFGNKYTFNEQQFSIVFKDQNITNEMEDVLSDGEKSIIAFCYYLASIHMIVNSEDDYKSLFYIIDDPISSMDFSYVFCVGRLIDSFCNTTPSSKNPIIVLTHNLEFMNILIKNNLVNFKYVLSNGTISKLTKELISPYENHLLDIINISEERSAPNHTTANSIRYILESIWKFVKPDLKTLEEFILQEEIFKNNEYIFTIINDFSHGTIRLEYSYTDEQIKEACKCVISYIDSHFPGQTKLAHTQV